MPLDSTEAINERFDRFERNLLAMIDRRIRISNCTLIVGLSIWTGILAAWIRS